MGFSREYYQEIEDGLRAVLAGVADLLPVDTVAFVDDMLDHNELGIALEVMVEALVESRAAVRKDLVGDLSDLARTMQLDLDVGAALSRSPD
jgi:hypothetical protein